MKTIMTKNDDGRRLRANDLDLKTITFVCSFIHCST